MLSLVAAGCSSSASGTDGPLSPTPSPSSSAPSAAALPAPSPVRSAAPNCAAQVFSRMSMAQRIGQLFLVGMPAAGGPGAEVAEAIRSYHFGSVLFVGDSTAGTAGVRKITAAAQASAPGDVRLFVAANQEGGQIQQLSGPGFAPVPSAVVQGTMAASALREQTAVWGRELKSAGVNLDLAPVMDVVPPGTAGQNAPIGMLQREYGGEPGIVASHGVAFIDGMRQAGLATSAKHFPGLGRVRGNTDFTANVVDTVTTAGDPYLSTYQAAIDAGVPFVMVALATYTRIDPGHIAAFSSRIMDGILRRRMHFQGVIVSDDLGGAAAVSGVSPGARAIGFLSAGGDLITSQTATAAIAMDQAVTQRAAGNAGFRAVVNDASMRVLDAKQAAGLLSCAT